jgi:tRNA(fMet)-specific endonuclease VapC
MGLMVDTNVFIRFEKHGMKADLAPWDPSERIYASVVTISELLTGVLRADTEARRLRRSDFVEAIITSVGVVDFTLNMARRHAEIHADLAKKGQMIGAHDLIIAATASHHDMPVLTENVGEFSRVPGLRVIPFKI